VKYGIGVDANKGIRALVAVIAVAGIVVAVTISNRRTVAGDDPHTSPKARRQHQHQRPQRTR